MPDSTSSLSTVFAGPEWLDAWMSAFASTDDSEPVSSSPFPCVMMKVRRRAVTIRSLRAPANYHTPRFDLPDVSLAVVAGVMRSSGAAFAVFPYLAEDAELLRQAAQDRGGMLLRELACETAPYVACDGDWEAYLASRSSKTRQEWRRRQRRATEAGFELLACQTPEAIERHFPEALDVEASGWKGEAGSAIRKDARALRFYTTVVPRLAAQGRVRLYLWRLGERTAAFQLCIVDGDALRSLKIGFDPAFGKYAPGQMLQLAILQTLFEDGVCRRFDLLGPDTPQKRIWATGDEVLRTLYCYRLSTGGIAMALWHRFADVLHLCARGWLRR